MQLTSKRIRHKRKHRTNRVLYGLKLGFFGGLIWGATHWLLYAIHFTKVIPGFLIEPFFRHAFLKTGWGQLAGLGSFVIFSIAATYLYMLILGRLRGPRWGILYGGVWWLVIFIWLGPLIGITEPYYKIGYDTLATELSIYLLWGLFIGYTIAFEFHDEATREPKEAAGAY
ncbi:YqhR family membrane protein [Paenibacillus spongiae]|uniref:YqhR family membrane protein n=1 Tax=Paenibacillus spongiae TaxID=2909671 RepID=A0ABY5SFF2_9BACL|nr:YqhR family membrane protein [Paenibacillus spongiae]UVI32273.1 YqhR family membrane protein [Paenibacillus spongiae]